MDYTPYPTALGLDATSHAELILAWDHLQANRLDEASAILNRLNPSFATVANARAVLCLRQGNITAALDLLRPLVLPNERSSFVGSADPAWCANFCLALLLGKNQDAFIDHVHTLHPAGHPAIRSLTDALNTWQLACKNLPAFKRLLGQKPPLTLPPGTPIGWSDAAVRTEPRIIAKPPAPPPKPAVVPPSVTPNLTPLPFPTFNPALTAMPPPSATSAPALSASSSKQTSTMASESPTIATRNQNTQAQMKSAEKDRVVRVFVSSTFRDMHAERDHLVTVVFPELRERLERLGLEFFDVDLRWGVPAKDTDGETANSWEYCRQWIDRVEPFFVCMLGQRYGWVPEPEQLKAAEDRQRQQEERRSITDMEIRHAVFTTKLKRCSFFYLRDREAPANATEYVDPPPLLEKLDSLKAEVRTGGRPVRDYPCEWTGSGFTDMEEFGHRVLEDLWSGVLRDERYVSKDTWRQVLGADPNNALRYADESIPVPRELWEQIVALAKPPPKDPLDAEREQMDAFAASRLRWFQGRTEELETLAGVIGSTGPDNERLAVVAALPGQGKSALLAKLSTLNLQSSTIQITHFVGATERSASAHALVARLLAELDRSGIVWSMDEQKEGEEPKQDFNSQCLRLAKRLGDYAGERRIVLLLDALNQLTDGHDLNWLPHQLGPSVRIIVSCVEDPAAKEEGPENRVLHALASRQSASLRVPLGPLTGEDVRVIVVAYLREYCKELDTPHVETICATPQARNPLYLLVMLGELRTLGGNEMNEVVPKILASMVTAYPDTVSLFRWVLQRLEVFGPDAVRWWCLYLAHGRVGMASHELADLLARKLGADGAATALLIERGLRRYLLRRGAQLDFFHGQLRQAVMEQYGLKAEPVAVHREVADYFTTCAKGPDPQKEWETDSVRGFSECVFHRVKAGQHDQAAGLLSNFPFLLQKLRVGLLKGVFEDYDIVRCEAPAEIVNQLDVWSAFFRENAHILRRGNDEWPTYKILLQLAVEHADDSPISRKAEQWLADDRCDWLWLRRTPRLPHVALNACQMVFEGHSSAVLGGMELPDGRVVSWSKDQTLRVWNQTTGQCLTVLAGHTGEVLGAISLPDIRLVSWSNDGMIMVWDLTVGGCINALRTNSDVVNGVIALQNGMLLSWSKNRTLQLWNLVTGACEAVLTGHVDNLLRPQEISGGRLLTASADATVRLWNARDGTPIAVLAGHLQAILGAVEASDGNIYSWSADQTLRAWDGTTGQCLATTSAADFACDESLPISQDRLLLWDGLAYDGKRRSTDLRLWDLRTATCLATFKGHSDPVRHASELADGSLLSCGHEGALRIWDMQSGEELKLLEEHSSAVLGACELADQRLASWGIDGTMRIWNLQAGRCTAVFGGHSDSIIGASQGSRNRMLSWSADGTLRLWNAQIAAFAEVLSGHYGSVLGGDVLLNDQYLTWSADGTLRRWSLDTGRCMAVMVQHLALVSGALQKADGRIISWSHDGRALLWEPDHDQCAGVLYGHTDNVRGALELPDGTLLTWSEDHTMRIWNLDAEPVVTWSGSSNLKDNLMRIWNDNSGACIATLSGHTSSIIGARLLTNGKLVSWSHDHTLRVWDLATRQCLLVFRGHREWVMDAFELADGRLLSWSGESTRLWDISSGQCLAVFPKGKESVQGAFESAGQRLKVWTKSDAFLLWDAATGECLGEFSLAEVARQHPEWLYERARKIDPGCVRGRHFAIASGCATHLRDDQSGKVLASWNSDSGAVARSLRPDGTVVSTLNSGQVCIIKLYRGNRRVRFADTHQLVDAVPLALEPVACEETAPHVGRAREVHERMICSRSAKEKPDTTPRPLTQLSELLVLNAMHDIATGSDHNVTPDRYALAGTTRAKNLVGCDNVAPVGSSPASRSLRKSGRGWDLPPIGPEVDPDDTVDPLPPRYAGMLDAVVRLVAEERADDADAGDWLGIRYDPSFWMSGEPVLLLNVDLIKMEEEKVVAMMGGLGMMAVSDYLSDPAGFLRGQLDAFTMLCNFPVFPGHAAPLYRLARQHPSLAVRCASILALRNSQFIDAAVIPYLSSLMLDQSHVVRYAALLALAASPSFNRPDVTLEACQIPTDEVLSNMERLLAAGCEWESVIPMAGILSRSPYIFNPRVQGICQRLKRVRFNSESTSLSSYYQECLSIIEHSR